MYVVRGPRRKGESNISMDSITTRDTCTVGCTDMVMVGKRGGVSTKRMRNLGTHTLVERSPSMWETYMFVCCRKRRLRHRSKFSDDTEWQQPVLQHRDASNECDW